MQILPHRRILTLSPRHLVTLSSLLAFAVTAAAQTPPTTEPATQPATQSATEPATQSATQAATAPRPLFTTTRPATTLSSRVRFNFTDAPIDSVVNYLAESFGFTIIKDGRVEGRVTVIRPNPVGADEAVDILDSILKPKNYAVLRTGMVLRVAPRDQIVKLAPVHIGADPNQINDTDELITQVIPFVHLDAVRLKQDLASMFSTDAEVAANTSSNTLVITDTSARIKRIVEVVASMDHQITASTDIRVFKLKYANASAVAKLITDTFKTDNSPSQSQGGGGRGTFNIGGFGGGGRGGGGGGAAGGNAANQNAALSGKVTASSDDRTNTVIVTGPTEILKVIETEIINKLDLDPAQETTFFVYSLKNANATNLMGVLNGFFSTGSGGTTSTAANSRATTSFTALGTSASGGVTGGAGASRTTQSLGTSSSGSSSGARPGSTGTANSAITSAAQDLAGQAYVVAEPDTNSLLVTVKTANLERVLELIRALDRDVPQVLIKVLVCEVTHTNSSDIGVEYSILNQRPVTTSSTTGGVTSTTTSLVGQSGGTDFGLSSAIANATASGTPNGLVAKIVESNISAALKALATTGKLDVLSRPSILASDNQLASIMVGQLVPIITASNISDVGTVVNSVTYQQVGIILNVTPHINPDGLVILDVQPQVSQLDAQTVTIQAGVNAPIIDLRQAQSRVEIRNGQTIIIGGLMQDQKTETVDKIPLLGDIPWVGALFSHKTESKSKTELLIFITPQVAQSPDQLPAMSKDEQRGTQLVPNAVAPGTFDQHIQGMQRGSAVPIPPAPGYKPLPQGPTTQPNVYPGMGPGSGLSPAPGISPAPLLPPMPPNPNP